MATHGIGERLKAAREKKGLTQQQLGDLVGVDPDTIGSYERERLQLWRHADKVEAIATALEVTPESLMTAVELQQPLIRVVEVTRIPLYGATSAGLPFTPNADQEWFEVEKWQGTRRHYARPVIGRSMEPVLFEGDIVEFEEIAPETGWIVDAFDDEGNVTIKAYRHRNNKMVLEAVNPAYNPVEGKWNAVACAFRIYRDLGFGHQTVIRNKYGGPLSVDRL